MNEMGIDPSYPKMNLSKRMQQAKVCPYLLRNAVIDRPNNAELKQMSKLQKVFLPITTVFNPRTYRDIKKLIRDEKIDHHAATESLR